MPPAWLVADRDAFEAGFVRQTCGAVDGAVIQAWWAAADVAERRWYGKPPGRPGPLNEAYADDWQFDRMSR